MSSNTLTNEAVLVSTGDHVATEVDGQLVMMSVEQGRYYSLDEVGLRIWELLKEPVSVGQLLDTLIAEYEVDRATCESDIVPFLDELIENGLVEQVDAPSSTT